MYLLYILVSENFIYYYLFSKPHFCQKSNKIIENKYSENIINDFDQHLYLIESKTSNIIFEQNNLPKKFEVNYNNNIINKMI